MSNISDIFSNPFEILLYLEFFLYIYLILYLYQKKIKYQFNLQTKSNIYKLLKFNIS